MTVRTVLLAAFLTLAGGMTMAPAAFAQHVVTENEAGKLTLDALTATPRPVIRHVSYRPAYRSAYRPSFRVASYARTGHGYNRTAPLVQTVAYRRGAHAAPVRAAFALHRRRRT